MKKDMKPQSIVSKRYNRQKRCHEYLVKWKGDDRFARWENGHRLRKVAKNIELKLKNPQTINRLAKRSGKTSQRKKNQIFSNLNEEAIGNEKLQQPLKKNCNPPLAAREACQIRKTKEIRKKDKLKYCFNSVQLFINISKQFIHTSQNIINSSGTLLYQQGMFSRSQPRIYPLEPSEDLQNRSHDNEMKEEDVEIEAEEWQVIGMAVTEEGLFFEVRTEEENENAWVPRKVMVEKYPKKLLAFYESKVITIDQ